MMLTLTALFVLVLLSISFIVQAHGGRHKKQAKRVRALKGSSSSSLSSTNGCSHSLLLFNNNNKRTRRLDSDDDKYDKDKKRPETDDYSDYDDDDEAPAPVPASPPAAPSTTITSISLAPTTRVPPYTVSTNVADAFGNLVTLATCNDDDDDNDSISNLYQSGTQTVMHVEQLITYQYQLTTLGSTTTTTNNNNPNNRVNPVTAARAIESRLQAFLARQLLDCVYSDTAMQRRGILEFWSVSSQPVDQLHSSRSECETTTSSSSSSSTTYDHNNVATTTTTAAGDTSEVDCYIIRGGLTVQYFALGNDNDDSSSSSNANDNNNDKNMNSGQQQQQQSLLRQEEITDVRVVDTLGPILRFLFASGQLKDDYGEVVDTLWMDFTNVAIPGEEAGLTDDDDVLGGDPKNNAAPGSNTLSSSDNDRAIKVIPALALSLTIVALLAIIALVVWKRRRFQFCFCFQSGPARKALPDEYPLESKNTSMSPPSSTHDDASLTMQQSLHSGINAPLKHPIAGTTQNDQHGSSSPSATMMSEELPPKRHHRMRETDTSTSCGMDMELLSAKLEKSDSSSWWYPYEESREASLTSGYSYNKGPDKVYVLDDCASLEESTINLGPNFANDDIVDPEEDSFTRPIFVKTDFRLKQSSMEKSIEDLKPHESVSMDSRYYGSQDTVVL